MTTTVTTVTVSTITAMGLTGALGMLGTLMLVVLLLSKEIAATTGGPGGVRWARTLNIGFIPLLLSFVFIVGSRFSDVI